MEDRVAVLFNQARHALQYRNTTYRYFWQKEFFENGATAFEQKRTSNHSADQERIAYPEKKIQTKDEVLAELWRSMWP